MRLQYTKALALVDKDFSEEKEGLFKGYAAATGNIDRGNDIILKGAFTDSLAKTDPSKIRVLWQHSWDNPIGKTLSMSEDDNGLLVEGELLLDIERARDARTLIKNNAIDGLSIGFTVDDFSFDNNVRVIKKLTVHEFSFATFAMNTNAIVNDIKSAKLTTLRDCENYLRDACMMSRSEAKTFLSIVKKSRDVMDNEDEITASLVKLQQTLRGK